MKFCKIEVIDIIEVMRVDRWNKRIVNFYETRSFGRFGGNGVCNYLPSSMKCARIVYFLPFLRYYSRIVKF